MLDVEEQLRRYAEAAEAAVPSRSGTVRTRPSRIVAAAAVVVLAGLGALLASVQDDGDPITAESTGVHVLPVPERGARPELLPDGTPVWVVRHDDGTVSVLDATATHTPNGVGRLVGWCPNGRYLIDPAHGSIYDEHGAKLGGPAATGLPNYPVETTAGDRVTISTPALPQGTGSDHPGSDMCFEDLKDLTLHEPDLWPSVAADEVRDHSELVRVDDAVLLLRAGQTALLCKDGGVKYTLPPTCSGTPAPELDRDVAWAIIRGDIIVRSGAGGVIDIALIGDATLDTSDVTGSPTAPIDWLLTAKEVRDILPTLPLRRVDGRDHATLGPDEMTGVTRGGIDGVARMWGDESVSVEPGSEPVARVAYVVATVIAFPTAAEASITAERVVTLMLNEGGELVADAPAHYTAATDDEGEAFRTWLAAGANGEMVLFLQLQGSGDHTETFLRLLRAWAAPR